MSHELRFCRVRRKTNISSEFPIRPDFRNDGVVERLGNDPVAYRSRF